MTNDIIVGEYWLVEDKIGEGAFGQIFRTKHIITKNSYALKREESTVYSPQLPDEYKFLKLLEGHDHIPKVYWYGEKSGWNCIVIDMLGPSLHMLSKPDNFLLESNFPISLDQLLELDEFESIDDSKRFQMLVARKYKTFLVDFGLAAYYIDQNTGKHIQINKKMIKNKTGTARYTSINVHKGYQHTRRDDMESLGYIFLEMLSGSLPWSGTRVLRSQDRWARMKTIKSDTSLVELCKGCPMGFLKYLEYCRRLRYNEKPDYDYLRKLLIESTGSGCEAELVAQHSNSFNTPFRNDVSSSSRSRTYSLPFKDLEQVDHNVQRSNIYNNTNCKDYYLDKSHNDNRNKKITNIKKPVINSWFAPRNPVTLWDQQAAELEKAWNKGQSWNGSKDDDNNNSKSNYISPLVDEKITYSSPCKKPIYVNNIVMPGNSYGYNHSRKIHDNQQIKTANSDMKVHRKQKWEQDMANLLDSWRQSDQDITTDSQKSNYMPKNKVKEKSRMSHYPKNEFQVFDDEPQSSDGWTNHSIDFKHSNALEFGKGHDSCNSQSRQPSALSKSSKIRNSSYSAIVSHNYDSESRRKKN
nr:2769_t:CDS:2 [Entrophospora candida]